MKRCIRLIWPPEAGHSLGEEVFLAPGQARHGVLVLRLKVGVSVEMVGPAGLAKAVVSTATNGGRGQPPRLGVRLTSAWAGNSEAGATLGVHLALALIQPQRFDWAVEKAVELGARTLTPLITARTKPGLLRPGPARIDRWGRLAEEARKQCGRSEPLLVCPPTPLAEIIGHRGPKFFLSPAGAPSWPQFCPDQSPLVVVGPEGGFTATEEQMMEGAGFYSLGLGPVILRSETAALAVLARGLTSDQEQ